MKQPANNRGRRMRGTAAWRAGGLRAVMVAAVLFVAGCSAVGVAYNQADTLLAWKANDYFDFDTAQKQALRARLVTLLAWHRQEQLPLYARLLGEAQQRAQRPLSHDDAQWLIDSAKARYRVVTARSAPAIADVLLTMNPDNIRALEQQFAKDNRKFASEFKLDDGAEAQREERLTRTVKRIREWTGPLTAAQLARVRTLNEAVPNTEQLRLQDRQRRQREFLAILAMHHGKAELTRVLDAWFADWEKGRPPQMQAALNDGIEKRIVLYLDVANRLSGEQRRHVQDKLQGYIDDIHRLNGTAVPVAVAPLPAASWNRLLSVALTDLPAALQ